RIFTPRQRERDGAGPVWMEQRMSRYAIFDRGQVRLGDIERRGHDLRAGDCWACEAPRELFDYPDLPVLVDRLRAARTAKRPVILMMGGHPIKLGLSLFIIDLMESGFITHLATNGAGIIHDFELALVGGTSEDVAKWIRVGQ